MTDVDAVLLDLGGVFYLPDHARIGGALARLGVAIDPEDIDRAHYEGVAALRASGPDGTPLDHHGDGTSVWYAYNRAYASVCGVPDDALDEATTVLLAEFGLGDVWTRVIPGSREALVDLAALGLALAVVSNADGTVEAQLRTDGICQVGPGAGVEVGIVLDSGAVGIAKPDPGNGRAPSVISAPASVRHRLKPTSRTADFLREILTTRPTDRSIPCAHDC